MGFREFLKEQIGFGPALVFRLTVVFAPLLATSCVSRAKLDAVPQSTKNKSSKMQEIIGDNAATLANLNLGMLEYLSSKGILSVDDIIAKAQFEDKVLEANLRSGYFADQNRDFDMSEISLGEDDFGFIGRIEARRSTVTNQANDGDQATRSRIMLSDVLVWPPNASARLILQMRRAFERYAQNHGLAYRLSDDAAEKYKLLYNDAEPRFEFYACAPRFSPGEYITGLNKDSMTETEAQMDAEIEKEFSAVASEAQKMNALESAKKLMRRVMPESGITRNKTGKEAAQLLDSCINVFADSYDRWELDFLVTKEVKNGKPEYFQEIHLRTRVFWAARLVNGPLNGKPEMQKTVIFRSTQPLKPKVHLRVFGNIEKPKPFTIYNHVLGSEFDEETRKAIIENYGINFMAVKNKFISFLNKKGLPVRVFEGKNVEDLTELFKIARVWNFSKVAVDHVLKASSAVAAAGMLGHGFQDMQHLISAFEIADLLAPSTYGHFATSFFINVMVPTAVLTRRGIDTLEIDYLARMFRSGENPQFRKFAEVLQIFDYVMAGFAVGNGAVFVAQNWQGITNIFYTTHIVKALSDAYTLYSKGASVSTELVAKLMTDNETHFDKRRATIERILSETREKALKAFNAKAGTDVSLVSDLHKNLENYRNLVLDLTLYKERGPGNLEERVAEVQKLLGEIMKNAYCETLRNENIVSFVSESESGQDAAALAAVQSLQEAVGCAVQN